MDNNEATTSTLVNEENTNELRLRNTNEGVRDEGN
jgi:hypothetical protein